MVLKKSMTAMLIVVLVFGMFTSISSAKATDAKEEKKVSLGAESGSFETVGFFNFNPVTESQLDFYEQSGFNTLQFCDVSWYYLPGSASMNTYRANMLESMNQAQERGFKVYLILMSTVEQWTDPSAEAGNGHGESFDPANQAKMEERLGYIRETVKYFKSADGFSLFAGDPGGVMTSPAEGGLEYYVQMGLDVNDIIKEEAPDAEFNLNLWAIAQFEQWSVDPSTPEFYQADTSFGRQIINWDELLGNEIGIEIPGLDYYSKTAIELYSKTGNHPNPLYPSEADIAAVKAKETKRYWAFSHGLMPDVSGNVSFNTQRVYSYINKMREIGMNGVTMGNVQISSYPDLYAYGRFANDAAATPEQVLREYAGFLATEETADTLTEIFKFMNNFTNDQTQANFDERYAIPNFQTTITSAQTALDMLDTVTANESPAISLQESPESYLAKLKVRLKFIRDTVRPPDEPDKADYIASFDSYDFDNPSGSGKVGKLIVPTPYNLFEKHIEPIDISYASHGYVHVDIYAESAVNARGYVLLGSHPTDLGTWDIWMVNFNESLTAGWNHFAFKVSEGIYGGWGNINWSQLQSYRVLFFNDTSTPQTFYVKDLYTSNYKENILPGGGTGDTTDLSGLTLSSGGLSPAFASETTAYTSSVANNVTSLTVTGSVLHSNAAMTVNGIPTESGQASGAINLNVGVNLIPVVVTDRNGTTKTYEITVTRATSGSSGGGGGYTGSTSSSDNTVTAIDGKLTLPAGKKGKVSLGDTIAIDIPADATDKELKITIDKLVDIQKLLTNQDVPASPVFEILKNFSDNFKKAVTLTFTFDSNKVKSNQRAAVYYYDEAKKVWVEVEGGKVNGSTITVEVNHFTKFAVFVVDEAPVTDTEPKNTFTDVSGHWAEANIKLAVSSGIVNGYPDGTFKPGKKVTRAEFVVMLMNALKPQGEGAALTFTDTAKIGAWAQQAIAQAVQAGIIKGYGDGSFRPDAEITRAEMAVILANAMDQHGESNTATGFADDKNIPAWAKDGVAFVKKAGIVQGKGDNVFAPQDHATRAEAVTVLLNMLTHMSK